MPMESFLATVVEIQPFCLAQSSRLLYTSEKSQLQRKGKHDNPAFSLMLKPRPVLMNKGNSTSNMYHPKLLSVCAMTMAQTGPEVTMCRQGTGGGFRFSPPVPVDLMIKSFSSAEMNGCVSGESVTKPTHNKHQMMASPPWM